MCWSMLLFTLREAADEDALNAKRRAERAAAKKRESDGALAPDKQENGGVLGADSDMLVQEKEADNTQLEACFKKLVHSNVSWLNKVVQDASAFAETNSPRSKSALKHAMKSHLPVESSAAQKGAISLFVENIWPSLKTRGWTAEVLNEGEFSGTTCYVHAGRQYLSPHAVLRAVPSIHPELSKTVDTILSTTPTESEPQEEEAQVTEGTKLQLEAISYSSLSDFLDMYAPLQLLVDRATNRNITMARKALGTCASLIAAHALVKRASDSSVPQSVTDRLASLLALNKRIALPHPAWTPRHDAVLIQAIAKHGWIDQDHCCRAIVEDSSVKWGAPFDDGEISKAKATDEDDSTAEKQLAILRETAARAVSFFNAEQDILDELKGFNQTLVVKAYGLIKSAGTEGADSSSSIWEVDDNLLLQTFNGSTAMDPSVEDNGENKEVMFAELPTKKELMKRAKNVLSRSSALVEREVEVAMTAEVPLPDHGFISLDQSDPCNMLLSELLRGLSKVSFTKTSKTKNLCRKVCADALREAQKLQEGAKNNYGEGMANSQAHDLHKIVEQIRLIGENMTSSPRPAKNVLRVVLGDTPILPKDPLEPIFPVVGAAVLGSYSVEGGNVLSNRGATKKQEKQEGTTGSRAITSAISLAFEEYKQSSGKFSTVEPDMLELSAMETLLISVICSQGLPVWSENCESLFAENDARPELQGPGHENAITWHGVGLVTEKAAEVWHRTALARLQHARECLGPASTKDKLLEEIRQLEVDERFKRRAVADAKRDCADPTKLAKKCVMLLEALRTRMGSANTKRGSTLRAIKSLNKAENGLGQLVLGWFAKELFRWAQSLDILNAMQRPLCYTASDYAGEVDVDGVGVLSIMDKKSCRSVIAQIAQLSRTRAVFVKNSSEDIRTLVEKAAKNSSSLEDVWEKKPSWWNATHDHDLLAGILEDGYSGCDNLVLGMQVREYPVS
jgi:hypothetical protein